jgi:hypothetical protein
MLHLSIRQTEHGFTWTLVRYLGHGADVLAWSARYLPDELSCRRTLERLAKIPPGRVSATRGPTGWWRWTLPGDDGRPLVESPAIYHSRGECERAFADVQRDAWAVPVG